MIRLSYAPKPYSSYSGPSIRELDFLGYGRRVYGLMGPGIELLGV